MPELITPRGFHTHGKEFFEASEAVFAAPKHSLLALSFLWGRSVELILKSYLLSVGVSPQQLRSRALGHNLVALYKKACLLGLGPLIGSDTKIVALMEFLNLDYVSKRLEYRDSGARYALLDPQLARPLIKRLLKGVNFHLRQQASNSNSTRPPSAAGE